MGKYKENITIAVPVSSCIPKFTEKCLSYAAVR